MRTIAALGLLASGSDWSDRSYGLTGTGKATAPRSAASQGHRPANHPVALSNHRQRIRL